MNLSSVTEVASGIQICLKEGLALTVSIFLEKKTEALTAAASYQELAGFFCWPKRSWGICVFIRLAT